MIVVIFSNGIKVGYYLLLVDESPCGIDYFEPIPAPSLCKGKGVSELEEGA